MAHGNAGDDVGRHRPLVVAQRVRGHATKAPQALVDTSDQGRDRLIGRWHHDTKARPGEPCAKQPCAHTADVRPVTPVELEPHAGLGYPRSIQPAPPGPPGFLRFGHPPARRSLRTAISERDQLVVHDISTHLALGRLDPLLELVEVIVDDLSAPSRARREPSLLSRLDVVSDCARGAPRQLGRVSVTLGQVECFENLHDLLVRLHVSLLGNWVHEHAQNTEEGHPGGGCHPATVKHNPELVAANARHSWPLARS